MAGSAGIEATTLGERVLVLAPVGRDAAIASQLLVRYGLASVACGDMAELAGLVREGAGGVLMTEEALAPAAVSSLVAALQAEPPWSDLPMVLLAGGESRLDDGRTFAALRAAGSLTV